MLKITHGREHNRNTDLRKLARHEIRIRFSSIFSIINILEIIKNITHKTQSFSTLTSHCPDFLQHMIKHQLPLLQNSGGRKPSLAWRRDFLAHSRDFVHVQCKLHNKIYVALCRHHKLSSDAHFSVRILFHTVWFGFWLYFGSSRHFATCT